MRSRGLNRKHQKALALLKSGHISVKEVAKQVGMSRQHLHDLISGKGKAGAIADEFHASYQKHMDYLDRKTSLETTLFINKMLSLLHGWSKTLKEPASLTRDEVKSMIDILKMLGTIPKPAYNTASYEKAMTQEELASEFARLKSIADAAISKKN